MPSVQINSHGVEAVAKFGAALGRLLNHVESLENRAWIEPPLEKSDFGDLQSLLAEALPKSENDRPLAHQNAIIETAVRDCFGKLVASTPIDSPAFVHVWNLLDILSIISDMEQCDPALLFWLVEELLDSQTISGCRKIFDFLESRRSRITAKHFVAKKLVVLRSCNELLRRLSRARDTAFCGRVFIFMFQSFPLGDKSSVNLRGEYHVDNVTTFDVISDQPNGHPDKMAVDSLATGTKDTECQTTTPRPASTDPASVGFRADMDRLYPVFWSLQASFSQPKRLFDPGHFAEFKAGLAATLANFRTAQTKQTSRAQKQAEEPILGHKRKRNDEEEDLADAFNPRYLTSRDLFELELSDLTFRRHILVQALIIMDFLLSLSAEAKEKVSEGKGLNKSVIYSDQILGKEDTEWATKMRHDILNHLRLALVDGAYFLRMVDTVLARDKNWVKWKVDNCPSIELPPIPPDTFADTKSAARRSATNKRLRATPMNALSIDFLDDGGDAPALAKFKATDRYRVPDLDALRRKIEDDDLEIEMAADSQVKAAVLEAKASKSWRALRIASRSRLVLFDCIDDPDLIKAVFEKGDRFASDEIGDKGPAGQRPDDVRPVIVSGPPSVGKSSLINLIMDRIPGVFSKVPSCTTRPRQEGETDDAHFRFVDGSTFGMMRDGDQLLEFSTIGGHEYGVSRLAAEAISNAGKIPLMELSLDSAQQAKDNGYRARHVLIKPPGIDIFETRLRDLGHPPERVEEALRIASEQQEMPKADALHDFAVVNDELEGGFKSLQQFIYGAMLENELESIP